MGRQVLSIPYNNISLDNTTALANFGCSFGLAGDVLL
jgi:hypothetical protein